MKIYYYNIEKNHKSASTDEFIIKSVKDYADIEKIRLPDEICVKRTKYGKPYVDVDNLYISVTHTDLLLIIAISDFEIGIDCENKNRIVKNKEQIIKKYFSQKEQYYVENSNEKFLEIWVKKEAYLKYLGTGFRDILKADTKNVTGIFNKIPHNDNIIYVYTDKESSSLI